MLLGCLYLYWHSEEALTNDSKDEKVFFVIREELKREKKMIKIIEKGQKTFTITCDRCGCKFQYDLEDLCGLDYIECPCCYTLLTHIGLNTNKIDLNKNNKIDWDNLNKFITPCKVEVGDGNYDYVTTTGTGPTSKVKANNVTK